MKIYVDAAPNKWEKVVNHYGKILRGSNGFKIGGTDVNGKELFTKINTKAIWQIEGEAYAILKGIEYAIENEIHEIEIINDSQCLVAAVNNSFRMKKSKSKAGNYIWLAGKLAYENYIVATASWCPSEENKADSISRVVNVLN